MMLFCCWWCWGALPIFVVYAWIRLVSRGISRASVQVAGGQKRGLKIAGDWYSRLWRGCWCSSGYGKELIDSGDAHNLRGEETAGEHSSTWQRWHAEAEDGGRLEILWRNIGNLVGKSLLRASVLSVKPKCWLPPFWVSCSVITRGLSWEAGKAAGLLFNPKMPSEDLLSVLHCSERQEADKQLPAVTVT